MSPMISHGRPLLRLATQVRSFADLTAQPAEIRAAEEVCRAGCVPDWPGFGRLRPAEHLVEPAARRILVAVQEMLLPVEGTYLVNPERGWLHDAQAYAVG